ncbi:hypothetical protein, partial [Thiolapillus sp.]
QLDLIVQACLRPRDRFWDIPVPKIDSAFDNLLVPQPSWSPSTTQQLRKLVAAPYLSPNDWTPRSEAYFVFPLAQGTPGKQCGLAATGVYQPSLRSPWLAAVADLAGSRLPAAAVDPVLPTLDTHHCRCIDACDGHNLGLSGYPRVVLNAVDRSKAERIRCGVCRTAAHLYIAHIRTGNRTLIIGDDAAFGRSRLCEHGNPVSCTITEFRGESKTAIGGHTQVVTAIVL